MKKASLPRTAPRERHKATLRTFLGRRHSLTLDSSTCCLKNSMIIIPQTCGVVKYFFQFPTKFFCHSAERQKNIRNLNQTPYFRVFRRMPGPMVVAMVALLK